MNKYKYFRKRDKRVDAYKKKLQKRAEENKKKTLELQKKQREERQKLFEEGIYIIYYSLYFFSQ